MTPYYEDDAVTIYHGDCRYIDAWLWADVLVTDPPYGRSWRQGNIKGHSRNPDSNDGIANDKDTSVRDAALALWGDRPAIVFGDLMLPPPQDLDSPAFMQKSRARKGFVVRSVVCVAMRRPYISSVRGGPVWVAGRRCSVPETRSAALRVPCRQVAGTLTRNQAT